MKNYLLRDIDPALWRRVKNLSYLKEVPIRSIILDLLEKAVEVNDA